jgi:hypothetical protein
MHGPQEGSRHRQGGHLSLHEDVVMDTCTICAHPPHEGRCGAPITESIRQDPLRTTIVGTCTCGLTDSLIATLAVEVEASAHE